MILKKPANFDEDNSKDKDKGKPYYMVQRSELVERFEISQDWEDNIEMNPAPPSTLVHLPNADWINKLKLKGFDLDEFKLEEIGKEGRSCEVCEPVNNKSAENAGIIISIYGFDIDTKNQTQVKIGKETKILLGFINNVNKINVQESVGFFITMYASGEDSQLLEALEEKWAAVKKSNDNNADLSQPSKILDEDGSNQNQAQSEDTQIQTPPLTIDKKHKQLIPLDNQNCQEQQKLSGQPPVMSVDVTILNQEESKGAQLQPSSSINGQVKNLDTTEEKVSFGEKQQQNQELGGNPDLLEQDINEGGIKTDSKQLNVTPSFTEDENKIMNLLKQDETEQGDTDPSKLTQGGNEEVTSQNPEQSEGTQNQTTQDQEQNIFNDNIISKGKQNSSEQLLATSEDKDGLNQELISETSLSGSPKSPENIKDLIPNSETVKPILKKDKKEMKKGAEDDKAQTNDNKRESSVSKKDEKSWWENPFIYGGLIVISILVLGLVVHTFHKRETISEEDK